MFFDLILFLHSGLIVGLPWSTRFNLHIYVQWSDASESRRRESIIQSDRKEKKMPDKTVAGKNLALFETLKPCESLLSQDQNLV